MLSNQSPKKTVAEIDHSFTRLSIKSDYNTVNKTRLNRHYVYALFLLIKALEWIQNYFIVEFIDTLTD